jgi:hypothetical protein
MPEIPWRFIRLMGARGTGAALRMRVPETAKRLRGRIANVLDAAKASHSHCR